MRICVLSEYFYPDATGGTGTVLSNLLRQLKATGPDIEIDVITSKNLFRGTPVPLSRQEMWEGISITRLKTPVPRQKSVKRRLATNLIFSLATLNRLLLRRNRYDVIMVVTAPPTLPLAANLFARWTGTPYVYLVYDLYLDMAINMKMLRPESRVVRVCEKVQREWFHRANKVVVLGRCMRDFVSRRYDVARENLEVAPIPANLRLVHASSTNTEFRRQNNLDGFVVLYAGNFAKYQDFDTLLDAAQLLQDEKEIHFVFVGDGAKREAIKSRIETDKLSNVSMFPFVPEEQLSDLLASANVSLVTLERGVEGLAVPSKFYNILASARPAVVVSGGESEVARVVKEENCGRHVEPENALQLAQTLKELAQNPAETEAMGRRGRLLCEQKYSVEHIARHFYTIFQNIAQQPAPTFQRSAATKMATAPTGLDEELKSSSLTSASRQ